MGKGGDSLSTLSSVMGETWYFYVESKSFELVKDAGTNGLCIIEHGKKHMSNVILEREVAIWFSL